MKLKSFFIIVFCVSFFSICNAQIPDEPMTISQYPAFYNETIQKMNNIIPNKTQYYGKPLSVFLAALNQNNIVIKSYDPGPYNNKLLSFTFVWNRDIRLMRYQLDYVEPEIRIFFQQPFNYQQASTMLSTNGYYSYWNVQAENFFKDIIVEKIEFWYVSGLTDKNSPPK